MAAGPIGACWVEDSWEDTAWEENSWADAVVALAFVLDLNTRLHVYLCDLYSAPESSDLTALVRRYLNSQSGDMNARMQKLITDATDAMS